MKEIRIESSSYLGVKPGDRVTVGKTEYEIMRIDHYSRKERIVAHGRGEAMAQRFVFESDGMTLIGAVLMALREATSEKESVCEPDVACHIASRISERLLHHVACASEQARKAEDMLRAECARSEVKDKEIARLKEYIAGMRQECKACARKHSAEVGKTIDPDEGAEISPGRDLSETDLMHIDPRFRSQYAVMCPECGKIIPESRGGCPCMAELIKQRMAEHESKSE